MNVPYVNINALLGILTPFAKVMAGKVIPVIPSSAFQSLENALGRLEAVPASMESDNRPVLPRVPVFFYPSATPKC